MKLAEWFEGREVLVCTHVDRDHIHSHFLINSVSFENGKKLHVSEPELTELRQRNDQVCMAFDLPVFQPQKKKRLISVAQNAGFRLLFLPPYSPELNPIEKF